MNGKANSNFITSPIAIAIVAVTWTVLVSVSFFWNQEIISKTTQKSFAIKGQSSERFVEILLDWTERHNEVYVPITPLNPQNPYLETSNKFIKRADGKVFTQISVARILDQFSDSFEDPSYSLSLISNEPLNPKNLAQGWQKKVLMDDSINQGIYQKVVEQQFYYMAPLTVNDSCFKCHDKAKTAANNTLGAIVFSYDISQLLEMEAPLHRQNLLIHLIIYIVMFVIILFSLNRIKRLITQLEYEKINRDNIIAQKTNVLKKEIQEHKEARNALQRFSTHDPLTGVRNRRHLLDALNQELKRYQRYKRNFSLLIIDLDHFRQINDKYGNECGDIVLTRFAQLITPTLRQSDTFARYDGEEFAIIATKTQPDSALRFAKKLVNEISQQAVIYQGKTIELSISIGVTAPSLLPKASNELLLASATDALNIAKKGGRNCAVSAKLYSK